MSGRCILSASDSVLLLCLSLYDIQLPSLSSICLPSGCLPCLLHMLTQLQHATASVRKMSEIERDSEEREVKGVDNFYLA